MTKKGISMQYSWPVPVTLLRVYILHDACLQPVFSNSSVFVLYLIGPFNISLRKKRGAKTAPQRHRFCPQNRPLCGTICLDAVQASLTPFSKTAPLRHQFGSTFFLGVVLFCIQISKILCLCTVTRVIQGQAFSWL